jgi:hypothetical protein
MNKLIGVGVLAGAIVLASAAPAFAHSCANASRPPSTQGRAGGEGRWFYIAAAGAWVFDMPNDGSLLEGSRHCTEGVPQADKVYWNWDAGSTPHGIVTGCGEAP